MKTYPTLKYKILSDYYDDKVKEQFYKAYKPINTPVIQIDYGKVRLFIPITTSSENYKIQIEFKTGHKYYDYITYNYAYLNKINFIEILMNQYDNQKVYFIKNKLKELIDNKPFYLEDNTDFLNQFKEKIGPTLSVVDILE